MDLTVVLVGPTGHGKSQTGNTILGREAFISIDHSSSGTETCELQTSVLRDGRTISVIDTPGFVDTESVLLGEEVQKCFHLARNKIHAILFVVPYCRGFSKEDQIVAVRKLQKIFGENIINYMIVVLTGGDAFQALSLIFGNDVEAILGKDMTRLCEGRYVYINNMTKNEVKRYEQVQKLLSQVETVASHNGGLPFMSQVFEIQLEVEARLRDTTSSLDQQMEAATLKANERAEKYLKEETSELIQRISKSYEEQMTQRLEAVEQRVLDTTTRLQQQLAEAYAAQMKVNKIARKQMKQRINEEVESRVKDVTTTLEQQLAEAEAARLKADERAQEAQKNSDEQILKLKDVLERAQEAQKNSDEEIQKLKEVLERAESRRSETISDFGSSSFHVYDPSTYELQSAIK